jgi:hypothetical protein
VIALRVALPLIITMLASAACTPTRSSLKPPYALRGQTYDERQIRELARRECKRAASVEPEHPFTTDGCSLWRDSSWQECCIEHDLIYWCGANSDNRRVADRGLRACVVQHQSSSFNAGLMYWGVRIGGNRWLPFPWRWGYGRDWPASQGAEAPAESAPADQGAHNQDPGHGEVSEHTGHDEQTAPALPAAIPR